MKPNIIAICGARRSGKDTLAHVLETRYGYTHLKISQELKDVVSKLFCLDEEQLESDNKDVLDERYGITPREIMQFFGTEMMQYKIGELLPNVGRKFWINLFIRKYIHAGTYQKIVISDMRFVHEYEELKKYNAMIVRVDRSNHSYANEKIDQHVSEKEYNEIPYDIKLDNNASIQDFENKCIKTFFNL